jgi:hypothetical protein
MEVADSNLVKVALQRVEKRADKDKASAIGKP